MANNLNQLKKKYKAIFFDMDGTLLPMDMKEFTDGYFGLLYEQVKKFGYDKQEFIAAIWKSVGAMVMNDGSCSNRDIFWKCFEKLLPGNISEVEKVCDSFYANEFNEAKKFTDDNPLAKEAVKIAHEKAVNVILATNPLFPMDGQLTRMGWINLQDKDFDFVTSYENSNSCKPNPKYFESICTKYNLEPSECLHIGNDEEEDGFCCKALGIDCFIVTDTIIKSKNRTLDGPSGTFVEMLEMLKNLERF